MSVGVNNRSNRNAGALADNLKTIGYALLIAILIRIFLFQPFNIPSGSMIPTLLVGDYLFVAKYEYGFSRHSFPFSPALFSGRIWGSQPERGDVAVFKVQTEEGLVDYIKRVIGLPGDKIQVIGGELYINGNLIERVPAEDYPLVSEFGSVRMAPSFYETLPNGARYRILDLQPNGRGDNTAEFNIPYGYYFMMGDNRDNSTDSRFTIGFIPEENLVGEAKFLFYSTDGSARIWQFWKWPSATRWDRIFAAIE